MGYDRTRARQDVAKYGEEYVLERLLWSEYRLERGEIDKDALPRYVNDQIRHRDYTAPKGYKSPTEIEAERLRRAEIEKAKGIARRKELAAQKAREKREEANEAKTWSLFEKLPPSVQEEIREDRSQERSVQIRSYAKGCNWKSHEGDVEGWRARLLLY